ncbi:MAG: hypothetical protein ACRCYQ_05990, partial [Nocardioides sp.]
DGLIEDAVSRFGDPGSDPRYDSATDSWYDADSELWYTADSSMVYDPDTGLWFHPESDLAYGEGSSSWSEPGPGYVPDYCSGVDLSEPSEPKPPKPKPKPQPPAQPQPQVPAQPPLLVNCASPATDELRIQCDTADVAADDLVGDAVDAGPLGGDSWRPPVREDWVTGIAEAAAAGFEAEFGPCAEFRPAFLQGVDVTKAYTQEDYEASVVRAWEACDVYSPRVGDRLPSRGDRVGAFTDTWDRGLAAMLENCALSGEPGPGVCPGMASHLPTLIVEALGNGADYGTGAAPSPGAESPLDAEAVRDRAGGLTSEAIAASGEENCDGFGDFITDDLFGDECILGDSVTDRPPEIEAAGGVYGDGFDRSALATAAYEEAISMGYTPAEAEQVRQVILNAPL